MSSKDTDNLERIGRAMQKAWARVKAAQSRAWGDWMTIGEGLLEGRRWAMQQAGVNAPEGRGYVTAFSEWLTRWRVHDLHKADRAKLLQLMEDRVAVEEWRATLTVPDRRNLNNPTVVWRRWRAATRVRKSRSRTAAVSATEHGRARAMIRELQARCDELEQELASARQSSGEASLDDLLEATAAKLRPMAKSDQESAFKRLRDMLEPPTEENAAEVFL